jgi:3',5'-cyclic-AMP phosphodiesterase
LNPPRRRPLCAPAPRLGRLARPLARPLALAACLALVSSCLHAASERAERDLEVGRGSAGGTSFVVEDGLAAVRSASPGELVLWGNAPAFRITATSPPGAAAPWKITVRNALPDAVLEATAGGAALAVEALPSELATERVFRVALPGGEAAISLAPPDAAAPGAFRFAVMSDVQEAIDRVGDVFARMNEEGEARFAVGVGDLTSNGTDEQLERFQQELRALRMPYFVTLGNHELGTDPPRYHDYFGRGSSHFAFKGVRFTLLDSGSATIDPMVYGWLDGWLEQGRGATHVVAMHIPPIDPVGVRNGSFASRDEAAKLLGLLARGGVDLTLYGHIHSYYSFANAGIPAHISGGGGAIPERFDGVGRHFLTVDVGPAGVAQVAVVRVD